MYAQLWLCSMRFCFATCDVVVKRQITNITYHRPAAVLIALFRVTHCPLWFTASLDAWRAPYKADILDGGSVAEWLRRWTCNSQVASSIPGLSAVE